MATINEMLRQAKADGYVDENAEAKSILSSAPLCQVCTI